MKSKKGFSLAECIIAFSIIIAFSVLALSATAVAVKVQKNAVSDVQARSSCENFYQSIKIAYDSVGKSNDENVKNLFYQKLNDTITFVFATASLNAVSNLNETNNDYVGATVNALNNATMFFGELPNPYNRTFAFIYIYKCSSYQTTLKLNIRTNSYNYDISTTTNISSQTAKHQFSGSL